PPFMLLPRLRPVVRVSISMPTQRERTLYTPMESWFSSGTLLNPRLPRNIVSTPATSLSLSSRHQDTTSPPE
ncbi:hypothetical protein BGZ52_000063, partial [Haplosporangium bisporale]